MNKLTAVAYRLLGSVADAEDVVQDARLRLHQQSPPPDTPDAWLFRTVTNLAIDRLRRARVERRDYVGPWLPEPVVDAAADGATEVAEQLTLGFLLMLERLSASERAVFVLREGFDLSFDEIGEMLDVKPATARQRLRRARQNLAGEARFPCVPDEQRRLLDELLDAVAARDFGRVAALFSDDAVVYTDGGGVVSAALIPLTGPERIAQVTLHLAERSGMAGDPRAEVRNVTVNGAAGIAILIDGALETLVTVDTEGGLITRAYAMRNPNKLYTARLE